MSFSSIRSLSLVFLCITPSIAWIESSAEATPAAAPSGSLQDRDPATVVEDAAPKRQPDSSGAPAPEEDESKGYYLDPERGPTRFEPEYARWFDGSRRPPRYARAAIELATVLGIGTTYYWIESDPNKQDWDYIDLKDRSLHVEVKFDNNMFRTNFLLHPLAGTMSYWLSRANGLDIYQASAASFLSSATFEFLLEWLEKPSINDLIATPIGGVAGGEFFFHLGDYLNSAYGHDNAVQRVLAYSLGAPQGVHMAIEGTDAPSGSRDTLGYSAAYWHRFSVGYGVAEVANERSEQGTLHDLLFDAKLVAMPGFLRPGRFSVDFKQGNFTEARLRTSLTRGWLKDVDLWIGSDLVGHYRQDFTGSPDALVGTGAMIAASVDMRYVDRWLFNRRDQFAIFHFLGPSGKAWWGLGRGLTAHAEARLHFDFAGMISPAYRLFVAERGPDGTKTVLQLQNYYQGVGVSGRVASSLNLAGFELGGHARYGTYRSIDGLDRFTTPFDLMNTDQIIELGAALSYSPRETPLSLGIGWESLEHRSQMGPYSVSFGDRRATASVAIRF